MKGEEIPLAAKIMAVADVFDSLLSERKYKEPFSFNDLVSMIKQLSGTHFDPDIVKAFINCLDNIKDIYNKFSDKK